MAVMRIFQTSTRADSPLDASGGTEAKPPVSDFLTVQSFANFAVMTGAITAAWNALQKLSPVASAIWVPYVFALLWAVGSLLTSLDGLKKDKGGQKRVDVGSVVVAAILALINSLVLAGAVVGTDTVVS